MIVHFASKTCHKQRYNFFYLQRIFLRLDELNIFFYHFTKLKISNMMATLKLTLHHMKMRLQNCDGYIEIGEKWKKVICEKSSIWLKLLLEGCQ